MAAKVGYCGLDRRREPLQGDEIRACWEAGSPTDAPTLPGTPVFGQPVAAGSRLEFVEIDGSPAATAPVGSPGDPVLPVEPLFEAPPPTALTGEVRWSLWSDLEG